jgi:predicted RNase H-like nuclease
MRVMGIDGCRAGWVATIRPLAGGAAERIVTHDLAVLLGLPDLAAIAIDMPIGLPERIGPEGRGPEKALRPRLGPRQSSVFAVPSRAAVYAEDYAEASRLSLMTSEPPRKVSKQCFFLFPKMREIDGLLRANAIWAERVHECHPEGAFMAMNGGQPLAHPKKVKGQVHRLGIEERTRLLMDRAAFPPDFLQAIPKGAGWDDCLDSAACAWSAARIVRGEAMAFPENSVCDAHGLRMVIRV